MNPLLAPLPDYEEKLLRVIESWPEKIDRSESIQSYLIMQQEKLQKIQLIFNEQSDHKVTIHHVPTNTPPNYIELILIKKAREHGIEDPKERENHLATTMDP